MDLSKLTVDEYTTPNPIFVQPKAKLPEIWKLMQNKGIRHVLVEESEGKILGILSERDLTTFSQSQDFEKIEAQDIMSTNLLTVSPDAKLYEVALEMSKNKFGSTVVLSNDNSFTGIFTATDALNALVEILRGDLESKH